MNCQDFQKKWPDVFDGALSADEKREWEIHRNACSACRDEVEFFESLPLKLRGIPPANPLPPVFWQRQTETVMKMIERSQSPLQRFWHFLFQPRSAWMAAALVLLAFLGYRYLLRSPSSPLLRPEIASKISSENEALEIGFSNSEETWDLDLTETQIDQYYAHLAQRYLPTWEDDSGEKDWIEDLNEQDLNRAIQYFEKNIGRRTL